MTEHLTSKRCLLAGNWKMNPATAGEAGDIVQGILEAAEAHRGKVEVGVFPPFPWLLGVLELVEETPVELGAQDCFWEPAGAYTGAVSAAMLAGWCRWVIVGHSERRQHFHETDEEVAQKAAAAVAAGLDVIICVGERLEHYESGQTEQVVSDQVRLALDRLSADDSPHLVVAYEPVWAIGTGRNADPEHAYKTMRTIRAVIAGTIGEGAARQARVLYGGSVNAGNVEGYVELPNCDGCLVGGASLKPDEFSRMIATAAEVYGHTPASA